MTIKYSTSVGALMLHNAIYSRTTGTTHTCSIGLYGGERPDANTIQANWEKYKAGGTETLAIVSINTAYNAANSYWYASSLAAQVKPTQAGTATWAIIMLQAANAAVAPWNSASLAASFGAYMLVDVSTISGDGVVRLADVNLTTATAIAVVEMSLGFTNA